MDPHELMNAPPHVPVAPRGSRDRRCILGIALVELVAEEVIDRTEEEGAQATPLRISLLYSLSLDEAWEEHLD